MKATLTAMSLSLLASLAGAEGAGLRLSDIEVPHHSAPVDLAMWYPSGGGGEAARLGENPVFEGTDVRMSAEVAAGTFPVVLLSHGMGGSFRAQGWLAAGLAEQGAIVVAVNHPNTTWGDFDMSAGVKHWTRALDLSRALDALLETPDFTDRADLSRVMAAGFSFGGMTALTLGGMTANHAGAVRACEAHMSEMQVCGMLLSDDVRLQDVDPEMWDARYADDRITHVAAIDPGFVWGLTASDVDALVPDTLLIGLGGTADRMLDTDFDASGLAALLPSAQTERFVPAFHFSAMPVCKPAGEAILRAEEDDPVCTDPLGTDRAAVHAEIIRLLATQLGL